MHSALIISLCHRPDCRHPLISPTGRPRTSRLHRLITRSMSIKSISVNDCFNRFVSSTKRCFFSNETGHYFVKRRLERRIVSYYSPSDKSFDHTQFDSSMYKYCSTNFHHQDVQRQDILPQNRVTCTFLARLLFNYHLQIHQTTRHLNFFIRTFFTSDQQIRSNPACFIIEQ